MKTVVSYWNGLSKIQKHIIILKAVVASGLTYNHFYPESSHFGLIVNLLWLLAF